MRRKPASGERKDDKADPWKRPSRRIAAALFLLSAIVLSPAAATDALVPLPEQPSGTPWPTASWPVAPPVSGVDETALDTTIDAAVAGKDAHLGETRAVIIVQGGALVRERYHPGYGPDTRLPSWSMAKSITHALVGIAVRKGLIDIDKPMGNPHWAKDDPRAAIAWRQWVNMVDGQRYVELGARSPTGSDAARMIFGSGRLDVAAYAAALPLAATPGSRWNYNSAGEILVCDALTRAVAPGSATPETRRAAMLAWMRANLFDRIGMVTAQPEFDAEGLYIGSSFVYATAADFARLGLLYLRDGMWNGERVLPPGWVDFARSAGPAPNGGFYGAGWWITPTLSDGNAPTGAIDTGGPRDAFYALGYEGQVMLLVPSKDLVVVRLGRFAESRESWRALDDWMGRVARMFPNVSPGR